MGPVLPVPVGNFLPSALLLFALLIPVSHGLAAQGCLSTYPLYFYSAAAIEVDGRAEESVWASLPVETSFTFPWEPRKAPDTSFRALLDANHLYLLFSAYDNDVVLFPGADESNVARGDRVEIFFALNEDLNRYFCLEISPSSQVLDYEAAYYRKFRREWDLPGLQVATVRVGQTYTVEASIPCASLRELGFSELAPGGKIRVGLFRAEFARGPAGVEEHWISWCVPSVDHPDFHIPSAFGFFEVRTGE